jgi:hypothetical protein
VRNELATLASHPSSQNIRNVGMGKRNRIAAQYPPRWFYVFYILPRLVMAFCNPDRSSRPNYNSLYPSQQ